MSNSEESVDEYLDVDDGCGCAEIWERTSERRREAESTDADAAAADD